MPSYVIVGASRGIGYQFLQTLSKRDPSNTVVGLVRTPANTQAQVQSDNLTNVHILAGDLINAASLNTAAKETAKLTNGIVDHLIVNGAYISVDTQFKKPTDYIDNEQYFLDELTASVNTNAAGVLFSVNAFLPLLRKSTIKKVTIISSGMGDLDITIDALGSTAIPYSISKAAANMVVAKFSQELKSEGVIFLSLSPGVVATQELNPANAPPEIAKEWVSMFERMKGKYPHWTGPMTTEESVDMCLKVIENHEMKDTGAFLSHHGNKEWL